MVGVDGLALWWLMSIDTGGGGSVGGDVGAGKDFVGRDSSDHRNQIDINFNDDHRHRQEVSLEDRVVDIERMVYGEPRWSEPGIIRRQKRQAVLSMSNTMLLFIVLVLLIVEISTR